jgi:hypothetical protein
MDVGAAGALSLYNYQSALKSLSQNSASSASNGALASSNPQNSSVLQALASVYSATRDNGNALLPAADSLSSAAGASGYLAQLVSGIYSASVANGNTGVPVSGLASTDATLGGLDATMASTLFSGTGSNGADGFSSAAINANSTLALAAYNDQLNNTPATVTAAANAAAASLDPGKPASVQAAMQAAQAYSVVNNLNLLG